jgi:hypothetical protein
VEKTAHIPLKDSIIVPPKVIESSIFNGNFKVQCFNLKNDLNKIGPSRTIPLTIENINLVEQLKCGVGNKKKKKILKHLNNINSLDDLPTLKIGIGVRTINKLKRYFHISPIPNTSISDDPHRVFNFQLGSFWSKM